VLGLYFLVYSFWAQRFGGECLSPFSYLKSWWNVDG
jgi:hypothetical protein